MKKQLLLLSLILGVHLATATAFGQTRYSVTDLGDLPGGRDSSIANDINDAGVVVGRSNVGPNTHAFRWKDGVMTDLGDLPGGADLSAADGISSAGTVVGSASTPDGQIGFVWDGDALMPLDLADGATGNFVLAINDQGQAVGQMFFESPTHSPPVIWDGESITTIGTESGSANNINNRGQVVGRQVTDDGQKAFLWDDGVLTEIGRLPPGSGSIYATAINEHGQVVGFKDSDDGARAFLWDNGSTIDFGPFPGGSNTRAFDIDELGQVVGTGFIPDGPNRGSRAYIWNETDGIQDLNTMLDHSGDGWTLEHARAINNLGQIVGGGTNPRGIDHAFLLTPVPEPSTSLLFVCGGVGLLLFRQSSSISNITKGCVK